MKAFLALLFLVFLFCGCVQERQGESPGFFEKVIVDYAVDGDTIALQNGERVRLIGIDTPEKGEPCWQEAKDRMQQLVAGKEILMLKDVSERDKYGRLVRYVYADGNFVNLQMVQEGFAFAFPFEPDINLAPVFAAAELVAADGNGCLWKK